jgi:hypothetical protein
VTNGNRRILHANSAERRSERRLDNLVDRKSLRRIHRCRPPFCVECNLLLVRRVHLYVRGAVVRVLE